MSTRKWPNAVLAEIRRHANEKPDQEVCGIFVESPEGIKVVPSPNHHPTPEDACMWDPRLIREAGGAVLAIYHSHPNQVPPSLQDQKVADWMGLHHIVYVQGLDEFFELPPGPRWRPLLGRKWQWGVQDCWSLVKDYHALIHGIELPELQRPEEHDVEVWREVLLGIVRPGLFVSLDPKETPFPGDVLGMRTTSDGMDHLAVVVGDSIIHHLCDRLSRQDDLTSGWKKKILGRYRHERMLL